MSLPESPANLTPESSGARARRRRAARQAMFPADAEGQAALIAALARRAYPSLELFVLSLACGVIVGLGFLLDSQVVILLGILAAPIMTPWVGLLLSIFTSSPRFFFETFMALLIGGAMVFFGSALSGFAARLFLPLTFTNVFIHARLWLPALIVFAIDAVALVISFVRSEEKPYLPSVLIAYAFYLPIAAGGFGLGSGVEGIFPQGLLVFVVHFALASLLGLMTLFALKLKPTLMGIGLTLLMLVLSSITLMILMSGGSAPAQPPAAPTLTLAPVSTPSNIPPSSTWTAAPTPTLRPSQTATFTPTVTFLPAQTNTPTVEISATAETPSPLSAAVSVTPSQQPVIGIIKLDEGGVANLRQTPNGKYILPLENGTLVEAQTETRTVNGAEWLRVIVTVQGRRIEGWLLASAVSYTDPALNGGVTPAP